MKNKIYLWHALYYTFSVLAYVIYYLLWSLTALAIGKRTSDLGAAMAMTAVMLYVGVPVLVIFLSRFSLLKWYVDPFIAIATPLLLYCTMIIGKMKYVKGFFEAIGKVNQSLLNDSGEGLIFFVLLFLFGLIVSFSVKRKNGESISYRLIAKISGR